MGPLSMDKGLRWLLLVIDVERLHQLDLVI